MNDLWLWLHSPGPQLALGIVLLWTAINCDLALRDGRERHWAGVLLIVAVALASFPLAIGRFLSVLEAMR